MTTSEALRMLTLADLIDQAASDQPDAIYLSFQDYSTLTFGDVQRKVGLFRGRLAPVGRPGDRIGIMMRNSPSYPIAWLAIVTAGSIAVPINKRAGVDDAGYILEHSGVSTVICDGSTVDTAARAARERSLNLHLLNLDEDDDETGWVPALTALHPGSIANIQYTSGTTGFPKGCVLTHRFWLRMAIGAVEALSLTRSDRLATAQPHSYIDPQWNVVAAAVAGCELVILEGFHPSTFMRDASERGITIFYCLGVMPTLLMKQPASDWDTNHSLRAVYCSAIPTDNHAAIEERFNVPWYEAFGMTESGINTVVVPEEHDDLVGSGCIGRPVPHCEVSVLDADGNELPPGRTGELVLRGMGLMHGYYRDAEATESFFAGGWGHTGDLAEMDGSGRIYYKGRLKEMIRRGGENIAPGEIEEKIASHPAILECAVKGVPDPDLEEEVKAYIVLVDGAELTPRDFALFLEGRLAPYKIPRYVEFRNSLPHTPSERVAKHLLEPDDESWLQNTIDLKAINALNPVD